MPQSFAVVHLHVVFSTRLREPLIDADLLPRLHEYLGGAVTGTGCTPVAVGGVVDHVHLLVGLIRTLTIADLVRDVKVASSRWVHDTFPDRAGFAWQAGYAAFAVSHDRLAAVRGYIVRQAEHHRAVTYQDEVRGFLRAHGLEWDERYVWD